MNADSEHATLRLREGQAQEIEGTVEVVFADSWDDLCEVAAALASALEPFAGQDCACYGDSTCTWCAASHALRSYDGD